MLTGALAEPTRTTQMASRRVADIARLLFLCAGTLCQAIWPFFNIYSLAASSVFSIPFWRHFIAWLGSVEATSANFRRILKKGSVAVIVGGIAEMYMQVGSLLTQVC
jgi:1-acyl-sn-glycerol-3-phosphate acyltransferase